MGAGRRVRGQHFFGDDIAFELRALMAAIFFWPGHADPAPGPDLAAKLAGKPALAAMSDQGAELGLFAQEFAHFGAQLLGSGWQLDGVETEGSRHRRLVSLGQ